MSSLDNTRRKPICKKCLQPMKGNHKRISNAMGDNQWKCDKKGTFEELDTKEWAKLSSSTIPPIPDGFVFSPYFPTNSGGGCFLSREEQLFYHPAIYDQHLPMDICSPWLSHSPPGTVPHVQDGKWMLFYNNNIMNEKWSQIKQLFKQKELEGVVCLKCSTKYKNSRAANHDHGVIILYCNNSKNMEYIKKIGKNIVKKMNHPCRIFYKTNIQTREGTRATGCKKNSSYSVDGILTLNQGQCLLLSDSDDE